MTTIDHVRQNDTDQTVFFTIEIDGVTYNWHGDIPLDADPQAYAEAHQAEWAEVLRAKIERGSFKATW